MTTTAWTRSQADSLPLASYNGKGWTDKEVEFLQKTVGDPVREVAAALGRTIYGVSSARGVLNRGLFLGSDRPASGERLSPSHAGDEWDTPLCATHFVQVSVSGACALCE